MSNNGDPYVGPRPFELEDQKIFFGRGLEANELVSLVIAHPVVLIYSQSGAGKTSLIKAGVIPLLAEEEKFDVLPPARVREHGQANVQATNIANVYVFNALVSMSHGQDAPDVDKQLQEKLARMSLAEFLRERAQSSDRPETQKPTVVVFDQFEELFTFNPERWEDRRGFFEHVRDALEAFPMLRVVFSMREDFIAELDPYAAILPEKLRTRFRMERLRRKPALCAVAKPLEDGRAGGGRKFAEGVAEALVDNLLRLQVKTKDGTKEVMGEFIEPLQLQVVCQTLWRSLNARTKIITKKHLKTYGDVDQALTTFYEEAVRRTVEKTKFKEGTLRRWFERALITPTGTRGIVFRAENETGGIPNAVVDELENQRLVRFELRGGEKWYELTHDRLIRTIKAANQKWLLSRSGAEQTRLLLENKAKQWVREGKAETGLLDDAELLEAERWLASTEAAELGYSNTLLELTRTSRAALEERRREADEERRRIEERARTARRLKWLAASLALVSLAALTAAGYAYWQKKVADEQRDIAKASAEKVIEATKQAEENRRKALESSLVADEAHQHATKLEQQAKDTQMEQEAKQKLDNGDLGGAEEIYAHLLKTYRDRDDDEALARIWRSVGEIYQGKKGEPATAVKNYKRALELKEKLPGTKKTELGALHNQIAEAYYDAGKNGEALNHITIALNLFAAAGKKNNGPLLEKARETRDKIQRRIDSRNTPE